LTAAVPPIVTAAGLKEQLGSGVPPVIMLHERVTAPVYPPAGITAIVALATLPAVTEAGFSAPAASV
jgi:hypothetical protein